MTEIDEKNKGRRVKLIHCSDPYTKLESGALGTYQFATKNPPPVGIQHQIQWDDGSNLMLVEQDKFVFID